MRRLVLGLAALAIALGACKIDSTVYQPPNGDDIDAAEDDGGTDAPPSGIAVQVTPPSTEVSEGGQVTVQVRLTEAPPADRVVDVTGTALLTPAPAQLTFTPENWNVNRTVILSAGQDDDAEDSPVTVLFNGNGLVADGTAMVMITDDDTLALIVSPPSAVGVTEGASAPLSVMLSAQPTSSVVVSLSSMDPAIATVSPAQLTFTSSNWSMAQTAMVGGVADGDVDDESTVIVLDPSTEGVATHTVAANVTDDDILAIDATPSSLALAELVGAANHSGTINVRLTQAPTGSLVVDLAANPDGKVTLDRTQLTFTAANYMIQQPVVVTALQDVDVGNENVTLALSTGTPNVSERLIAVGITDDDTQAILVTPMSVPLLTEGNATNLSVRLAFAPTAPVIVNVTSNDPNVASVDVSQLTFTAGDYATPQVVQVTAIDDLDLADESTVISFNDAASGLTVNRTINVDDDDVQSLEVTPLTLGVPEGGQRTFTVQLRYQPAGNVTVNVGVTATNSGDISATPTSMVFTMGDYDQPRTVTVTGLQDVDTINEVASVVVSSTGLTSRTVTVNVSDDDAVDILVTPTTLEVNEGDLGGRMLGVSLGAMPAGNVTVTLELDPIDVADVSSTSLTFTPQNYATPQAVRVTGIDDPDGLDSSTTLTLSAPSLANRTVPITVIDDDVVAPMLSPNPVTITEGEFDMQVSVSLSADPGRAVTVDVSGITADFEISPTQFSFDSTNWFQPQSVTLRALSDDSADPENETATFVIAGEGSATLNVTTIDPTILIGFPPPNNSTFGAGVMGLEAFKDGIVPSCFAVEKIAVDVTAATMGSAISVALYTDELGLPGPLLWESFPQGIAAGAGVKVIDIPDQTILNFGSSQSWLAIEATTGVQIRTKTLVVTRCSRIHSFGDSMPDPFNAGGMTVPDPDGGMSDAGVLLSCNDRPALAVWLIARDGCQF